MRGKAQTTECISQRQRVCALVDQLVESFVSDFDSVLADAFSLWWVSQRSASNAAEQPLPTAIPRFHDNFVTPSESLSAVVGKSPKAIAPSK